ncbi:hypothetical protein CYMTET_20810 [Cymbomonas tetramitiformis]|uniref:Photolyase/cryptochrome alpha/beta domain-containing protein n=1 Tax=Cymbomonas tetramitiformis TaxID=36881 RepID=A0AAE0G397_9CHLO|nr:hypothetical protein CYMTET_20810 [Cymbomonas tetramitiformis]
METLAKSSLPVLRVTSPDAQVLDCWKARPWPTRAVPKAAKLTPAKLKRAVWRHRTLTRTAKNATGSPQGAASPQRAICAVSSSSVGASNTRISVSENTAAPASCSSSEKAVLIFTGFGDLRVHDNPGIVAASTAAELHALFVFQPEHLKRQSEREIRMLRSAVGELQVSLRERYGVELLVRVGDHAQTVRELCNEVGATTVYFSQSPLDQAVEDLCAIQGDSAPFSVHAYTTPLRLPAATTTTTDYRAYRRSALSAPPSKPLDGPSQWPRPAAANSSRMPEEHELFELAAAHRDGSVQAVRKAVEPLRHFAAPEQGGEATALNLLAEYASLGAVGFAERRLRAQVQPAGEDVASMEAQSVRRVLRGADGSDDTLDWGSLAPGEVFTRAFSELLALGCLSTRQVASMCGGMKEVMDVIEWREWHRLLATRDLEDDPARPDFSSMKYRYWQWHGHWVRYAVAGDMSQEKNPLVLVHGFGASSDQWHNQLNELSAERPVFAVDLLGFGHSEKPALTYNQYLWEDQVRDFCLAVVGRPFYIAGNSIGGYTALCAGVNCSAEVCRGIHLINSAGRMVSTQEYEQEVVEQGGTVKERMQELVNIPPYKPFPTWILSLGGQALLAFLQPSIGRICRNVYPNNADAVDERLTSNIFRDSNDPGALGVLCAGAKLPPPRSKNELFEEYSGSILVTQGLNDPLGGGIARERFDLYGEVLQGATLIPLEAGHCPMHEVPEEVNSAVREWASANDS